MPDYLSCGGCQSDFELSDILLFIEHKRYDCNVNSSSDFAMELLECVKCLRKFHTPWPLLRHVQSEHHISVVRNLVLPALSTVSVPTRVPSMEKAVDTRTSHTQTVKTCLKRLVCPYQTNLPDGCCLKIEAPSEEGCCCLDSTEKSTSHGEVSSCQSTCGLNANSSCHAETNIPDTLSSDNDKTAGKPPGFVDDSCPCSASIQSPTCCETRVNKDTQVSRCGTRSQSCCDPTQSYISFGDRQTSCTSKKRERNSNSLCQKAPSPARCPCKPSSNTADQTCQTDFVESFDIDMDLLLDSEDLNVAMDSTFQDEGPSSNANMLTPSKAIQTIVQASNFENYAVSAPSMIAHGTNVATDSMNASNGPSFVTTDPGTSSSGIQTTLRQYPEAYTPNDSEINSSFMYDHNQSNVHHMNTDGSQLWGNPPVSESLVVHQESLLNLLGSSTGLSSAGYDNSVTEQNENSSMQASQITASIGPHSVRIETLESKRKRSARDYRFNCTDCDKVFRQNVHLRKHIMAKHTKLKPHKCTYCRYTTVEKSHLTVHIRTHTGEKPFRCRICNYSTAQNCTLKSHYLRKHPGSSVQCNLCGTDFITNHERDKHEKVCRRDENLVTPDMTHIQVPNLFSQGNQAPNGNGLNEAKI